jgi:hypothetical protein
LVPGGRGTTQRPRGETSTSPRIRGADICVVRRPQTMTIVWILIVIILVLLVIALARRVL